MKINLIIVTAFVLTSARAYTQEPQAPVLNSNRIGFTESSRTVLKGGFLLESGFNYSRNKLYGNNNESYTSNFFKGPRLRLSYGITKFMEINVEGDFANWSYNSSTRGKHSYETSKYGLGVKFNLSKQKGMLPQTAISITESYFSNDSYLGSYFKTTANLAWTYNLGEHFELSGNLLFSCMEGNCNMTGLGLRFGYHFNERFGVFTEWYLSDQFTEFTVINMGVWYKVTPRFLVSLNVGTNMVTKYDWTHKGGNYNITLGASFLLNNPNKKGKKRKLKR